MRELRSTTLRDGRRISFKDRHDAVQRRSFPAFLRAADLIPGVCATVLVDRVLLKRDILPTQAQLLSLGPALDEIARPKPLVLQRTLRVLFFGMCFVVGLASSGQDMYWITDDDDIVANPTLKRGFGRLMRATRQSLLPDASGAVNCTCPSDCLPDVKLQWEDILSIPDLAAGTLATVHTGYRRAGAELGRGLILPVPDNTSQDIRELMGWLADDRKPLKRWVFLLRPGDSINSLNFTHIQLHARPRGIIA